MIEVTECKGDQKEKIQMIEPKVSKQKNILLGLIRKLKEIKEQVEKKGQII